MQHQPRQRHAVLVTSAGRRVELLRSFRSAAAALGLDLEVFACDRFPDLSSACVQADCSFAVPPVGDPSYAQVIADLCRRHGIGLVVPTIDPELLPLSQAAHRFAAAGVSVAVSAPAVIEIARDKLLTAQVMAGHGIPAPLTWSAEEALALGDLPWPLLAKPRHGSSGRAIGVVNNMQEVRDHCVGEPFVVQELLHGREFTTNMFIDAHGELACAVPHERLQVRAGEVEKGITRRVPALEDMARKLVTALPGVKGALCFQAIMAPDGGARLFEINARFGGGYPLAHQAGANFARWLLEETFGLPASAGDHWQENMLMLRYDAAMFVPLTE